MSGMEIFLGVLSAVGTLASAGGAIAAGQAEAGAAKANAKIAEQQAAAEREAAAAEASDFRRREKFKLAGARAARLASGVAMAGSPLLVDEATVQEIALGAARIRSQGENRAINFQNQAALNRAGASNAQTASYFRAGTSLLSGAYNLASGYV